MIANEALHSILQVILEVFYLQDTLGAAAESVVYCNKTPCTLLKQWMLAPSLVGILQHVASRPVLKECS